MRSWLNKELWQKIFQGWNITDISVRSKKVIYLALREGIDDDLIADDDIATRFLSLYLNREMDYPPYTSRLLEGFPHPRTGVCFKPKEQGLITGWNRGGAVIVVGPGGRWPMEHIDESAVVVTEKIKCINGYAYAAASCRKVYKRTELGQWIKITKGFPESKYDSSEGFNDISAFNDSEQDIYAVGGDGDIWHYDGDSWHQIGFPSNEQLSTVCCAPDGNIYVGGEGCSLWVGNKKHQWKKVFNGMSSVLWNDILWFNDKLYLSSDYWFKTWNGEELIDVINEATGERVYVSGHMDARDSVLAIASLMTVELYDGKTWRSIVTPYLEDE